MYFHLITIIHIITLALWLFFIIILLQYLKTQLSSRNKIINACLHCMTLPSCFVLEKYHLEPSQAWVCQLIFSNHSGSVIQRKQALITKSYTLNRNIFYMRCTLYRQIFWNISSHLISVAFTSLQQTESWCYLWCSNTTFFFIINTSN